MMGKKWKSKFWEDDIPDMTKDEQFQNCLAELESGHLSSYSNSDDPDAEVIKRGHQTSVDLRTSPNPKVPVTPISPEFHKKKKKRRPEQKTVSDYISSEPKKKTDPIQSTIDHAAKEIMEDLGIETDEDDNPILNESVLDDIDRDSDRIADMIVNKLFKDNEEDEDEEEIDYLGEPEDKKPEKKKSKYPISSGSEEENYGENNAPYQHVYKEEVDADWVNLVGYNPVTGMLRFLDVTATLDGRKGRVYTKTPHKIYIEDLADYMEKLKEYDLRILAEENGINFEDTNPREEEPEEQDGIRYDVQVEKEPDLDNVIGTQNEYDAIVRSLQLAALFGEDPNEAFEKYKDLYTDPAKFQRFMDTNTYTLNVPVPVNNKPIIAKQANSFMDIRKLVNMNRMIVSGVTLKNGITLPVMGKYEPNQRKFSENDIIFMDIDDGMGTVAIAFSVKSRVNIPANLWTISVDEHNDTGKKEIQELRITIPLLTMHWDGDEEEDIEDVEEDGEELLDEPEENLENVFDEDTNGYVVNTVLPDNMN